MCIYSGYLRSGHLIQILFNTGGHMKRFKYLKHWLRMFFFFISTNHLPLEIQCKKKYKTFFIWTLLTLCWLSNLFSHFSAWEPWLVIQEECGHHRCLITLLLVVLLIGHWKCGMQTLDSVYIHCTDILLQSDVCIYIKMCKYLQKYCL